LGYRYKWLLWFTDNISTDLREYRVLDVKPAEWLHAVHDVSGSDDNDVTGVSVARSAHWCWLFARGSFSLLISC